MSTILDMNEFRARQRAERRFHKDLDEASQHKAMRPHKPATPTEALRAAAQAAAGNASTGWPEVDKHLGGVSKGELLVFSSGKVHDSGFRKWGHKSADAYLDEIMEGAYNGSQWAQFRLALIQLADEAPGAIREQMQVAFPDIDPVKFEIWLDRATEEFDEYSDLLKETDQP